MNNELLLIGFSLTALAATLGAKYQMDKKAQFNLDAGRKCYTLVFPNGTTDKHIQSFLRSIGESLIPNAGDNGATPSVVFEVRWTPKGLRHILRVTAQDDAHVKLMLDAHIPGTARDPVDTKEESLDIDPVFTLAVEMTDKAWPLTITTPDEVSRGILGSVPTVGEGEIVAYQVLVSHTTSYAHPRQKIVRSLLRGAQPLSPEAEKILAKKRAEHNFDAGIRIAVQASDEIRGRQLAGGLIRTIRQVNNDLTQFNGRVPKGDAKQPLSLALSPRTPGAQLTVTELSALLAIPLNDPQIPGLTQGASRRLLATDAISSDGEWVIGFNNVHDHEKPITLSKEHVVKHVSVVGQTGSGKTVFLTNLVTQYVRAGLGIFMIDAGQDISTQRLFWRVLAAMPPERQADVICVNPADDPDNPVSINILDQGFGMGAITIVKGVFEAIYNDDAKGVVTVGEVLQHSLWTLIEVGTEEQPYTVIDLAALLSPRNDEEQAWAASLIRGTEDPELKDWWARHPGARAKLGHKDRAEWDKYVAPTLRRLWQLAGRPELRHIFGQSKSTIKIKDLIAENKIFLCTVGGMNDPGAATIAASLITQMVWYGAQTMPAPKEPNILVLDEFQVSANIQGGLPDMLARARALGLAVVLATQFITREDIPKHLRSAVFNNVATRIVFKVGDDEADRWARALDRKTVAVTDITRLPDFHGIAQVANDAGDRSPVTFKAHRPAPDTHITNQILAASRRTYGRSVEQVRHEIRERRRVAAPANAATDKPVGRGPYVPPNND